MERVSILDSIRYLFSMLSGNNEKNEIEKNTALEEKINAIKSEEKKLGATDRIESIEKELESFSISRNKKNSKLSNTHLNTQPTLSKSNSFDNHSKTIEKDEDEKIQEI